MTYATGGQHDQLQQLVGAPLSGTIPDATSPGASAGELQIERPDGRRTSITAQRSSTGYEWRYADTNVNGIYTLHGLPQGRVQKFAVNVDPAEGDLARVNVDHLPQELKVRSTWRGASTPNSSASIVSQSNWNQSLLWAVVALLFIELLMAWQFGRGTI